ncbi:hypothetical protein GF357_04740 [Candidatus Dojkabacteria bacterium]|nr:hypothetical protein [Candidatus Dojkabacteria bacterium]
MMSEMIELKWHKLSTKKKKYLSTANSALLLQSIPMTKRRVKEFLNNIDCKTELLILGVVGQNDTFVPGMEDSMQFRLATLDEVKQQLISLFKSNPKLKEQLEKKIVLLDYSYEVGKYVIRELKPKQIFWVNGSWRFSLHLRQEWWESYDLGVKIKRISPFANDNEAKSRAKKITAENLNWLTKKWKVNLDSDFAVDELKEFVQDISKLSWDWTGQTGACLVHEISGKNQTNSDSKKSDDSSRFEVITWSHNVVVPFESYIMHKGALKELHRTPPGENIELTQTNHAEVAAVLRAAEQGLNFENIDLVTSKFPCPVCARILADSPISRVYYSEGYSNGLGMMVLKGAGKSFLQI